MLITLVGVYMKYSKENLLKYVNECDTVTDLVKKIKGTDCVSKSSINLVSTKLKEFEIDTSHFIGSSKTYSNLVHKSKCYDDVLVFYKSMKSRAKRSTLLTAIKNEGSLEYKCSICGIVEYNGKPIILHIDHIDGNWRNNLIINLRFLCPNCHSQTDTYGFKCVKYK